ncbi:hypothetical protein [Mycolicibacterium fortuitum]|uniref:hypothetical protein n=1 Tax=Mycolicibacterium fortuitum TaxID=1766 RepID=UPI0010564C2C|nr:hypothetical protein [Mycolicibacterium fortuitum]
MSEWNPHTVAAAKAMYKRLNVHKRWPKWRDLDIDAFDHYCIAAELAIDAFHKSAIADIPSDWETRA